MPLMPTCDPHVLIEEQRVNYVRYRRDDGRRWEVHGSCTRCGNCWQGVAGEAPALDCPVTPELKGCEALSFTELPGA
jgi:hypothetical protein